ncbi:hypothetical protein GGQ76_002212 [Aureimonas jatrophae]|uniref:Uncharacterized protein n=1 Tax=Aureimonas jatrophae TaxID=1166073 RepID=A0A1H0K3A5_9HYPH|nr:hypothetical protein [Aureimonas jatrophae]SDO50181.1 hypothetical protein SAMN05192530_10764 [Aureimonas jatrophae]
MRSSLPTPRNHPADALRPRCPDPVRWGAAFGSAAGQGFSFGAPVGRPKASDWG